MKIKTAVLLVLLQLPWLLQGCAGVIVAGGATGASIVHDRRTMGSIIEDQSIELKAASALSQDPELDNSSHINVTSYNQIVLLTGEAPTQVLRDRAQEKVRTITHVRRVHNEITIAAPSAMGSRGSDTWITTRAKTSLLNIKGIKSFDPTRVKVVTENGVVYLMGLLARDEAEAVVDTVRKVKGVQRVVKVFEYLD